LLFGATFFGGDEKKRGGRTRVFYFFIFYFSFSKIQKQAKQDIHAPSICEGNSMEAIN
jgi:hypothetical protein